MKVDLSKLFVTPGGRQEFSCALDLGETKRLGRPLFLGPVRVSGAAENRSGVVSVGYTADFTLNLACDIISHDSRIKLRFLNFVDVYLNFLVVKLLQLFLTDMEQSGDALL